MAGALREAEAPEPRLHLRRWALKSCGRRTRRGLPQRGAPPPPVRCVLRNTATSACNRQARTGSLASRAGADREVRDSEFARALQSPRSLLLAARIAQ